MTNNYLNDAEAQICFTGNVKNLGKQRKEAISFFTSTKSLVF